MVTSGESLGSVQNITEIPFIINQENCYSLEGKDAKQGNLFGEVGQSGGGQADVQNTKGLAGSGDKRGAEKEKRSFPGIFEEQKVDSFNLENRMLITLV